MHKGELVNLYAYSPHSTDLANRIIHTGIFLEKDREEPDGGWIVLVDGIPRTFTKRWWKCKSINKEHKNV